jgi:hypothetical protein
MPDRLKLRALDEEDFGVIAALVQDALVPISEMAYLPEEKRFVMLLNRFRWETADSVDLDPHSGELPDQEPSTPEGAPIEDAPFEEDETAPRRHFERTHCGLCFDRVVAVRTKGIDMRARDRILELLTIQVEDGAVLLVFAGDAMIRLVVEALRCRMEDLGEAWPTRWRPQHGFEDGEGP